MGVRAGGPKRWPRPDCPIRGRRRRGGGGRGRSSCSPSLEKSGACQRQRPAAGEEVFLLPLPQNLLVRRPKRGTRETQEDGRRKGGEGERDGVSGSGQGRSGGWPGLEGARDSCEVLRGAGRVVGRLVRRGDDLTKTAAGPSPTAGGRQRQDAAGRGKSHVPFMRPPRLVQDLRCTRSGQSVEKRWTPRPAPRLRSRERTDLQQGER